MVGVGFGGVHNSNYSSAGIYLFGLVILLTFSLFIPIQVQIPLHLHCYSLLNIGYYVVIRYGLLEITRDEWVKVDYATDIWNCGKVYVDYRIKRHTPLPVLYISPPPTLLNFYHYRDSSR